ncbi:MAG: hypothetical protein A2172_03565 [Candidatus Woykebacteria bacterium RBG_13_40_15]|uniref:Uncharacterized protein n=1 Tax=Candidatus Woykebacteria bacterium RBG_13_40_15 TaxID=1802593 RepID=A0A1G1W5U1_9BACT|nr:MAG: hypothetical protein A2172_03565 [Candidatus Woykebacteria bacterium RBG_13_40_15]
MPKKTRAEKLAAQLRRLKMQSSVSGQQPSPINQTIPQPTAEVGQEKPREVPITTTKPVINIQQIIEKKQSPKDESQRYSYSYVKGDLRKIVVLASLAVAVEVGLNLTLRTSFAKLILRTFGIEI